MGLAWREDAGRGVSRACHLGAPGTVEEASSGCQFLGWALRWRAGRRWAGDRGHLHLPRACLQSSTGRAECWTPRPEAPGNTCDGVPGAQL